VIHEETEDELVVEETSYELANGQTTSSVEGIVHACAWPVVENDGCHVEAEHVDVQKVLEIGVTTI
jgi:hypothetical protein